jgi:hypothetical protein
MRRVTALAAVIAVIFAVTPIQMLAASPVLTGDIRGVVLDPAGRQLASGLRVQLINSRGIAVVGKTATVASDGSYILSNIEPGLYTVQVQGASGSTVVAVSAGRLALANVSATPARAQAAKAGMSTTTKWVIALVAIGGGATTWALIANKDDASGSQ